MMQNLSRTNNPEECGEKAKCPTTMGRHNRLEEVENVINERNMMPDIPNYSLKKNGDFSLNRKRHISSIPKNNSEYWIYPSSQQFYNSLMRKNKDIDKNYIDAVVSIHNEVNEESWKHILKYEYMHKKLGRPFDRHDWYVNRCGTEVKYILDYYNDESINDDKNIYIDVRPAMDSLSNVWDRVRYPFYEFYFKYIKKYELFR
ncbi:cytochrome c heme lyase, putative [Plasmodium ovale wallikeri]|uniref:Holocytochrome c-type synthase n=1 Tax=Plasmodium ovale wallikeri TaxID=864142 RepID=A0A1A8ZYS0_PLAOA|nr:cytochrome c heme lyase, putative [Plasmodium ovale wallikeri]SBT49461.1 cytochrome c heme lyase, putative [Plasmodium ovale wallikeri]